MAKRSKTNKAVEAATVEAIEAPTTQDKAQALFASILAFVLAYVLPCSYASTAGPRKMAWRRNDVDVPATWAALVALGKAIASGEIVRTGGHKYYANPGELFLRGDASKDGKRNPCSLGGYRAIVSSVGTGSGELRVQSTKDGGPDRTARVLAIGSAPSPDTLQSATQRMLDEAGDTVLYRVEDVDGTVYEIPAWALRMGRGVQSDGSGNGKRFGVLSFAGGERTAMAYCVSAIVARDNGNEAGEDASKAAAAAILSAVEAHRAAVEDDSLRQAKHDACEAMLFVPCPRDAS